MLTALRAQRRRRDERGAFTLSELMLVGTLSLIVLAITTTMLVTITGLSTETRNKIDAEVRARQSMDTAMRYLRNAVPIFGCSRWSNDTPIGNKLDSGMMQYCQGVTQVAPAVVSANGNQLEFYAYPTDTNPTANNAAPMGFSRAPDKFTLSASNGTMTIYQFPAASNSSMLSAACSLSTSPRRIECPMSPPTGIWSSRTTIGSFAVVANVSPFTYLSGSGGITEQPAAIRTVLVNLTMSFEARRVAGSTGPQTKQFVYYASAAIRGAVYQDDRQGN